MIQKTHSQQCFHFSKEFWINIECPHCIIFNSLFDVEPVSLERFFQFRKQPKVTGGYVETVQRLAMIRWVLWRIIVVTEKPVTAWPNIYFWFVTSCILSMLIQNWFITMQFLVSQGFLVLFYKNPIRLPIFDFFLLFNVFKIYSYN